jgi:hypothetical protein
LKKKEGINLARRTWTYTEEKILLDNYHDCTIKELEKLLPARSRDSINKKIKVFKAKGKIKTGKSVEAISRAYIQRKKEI